MRLWWTVVLVWTAVRSQAPSDIDGPYHPPTVLMAVVGGYAVFNCPLDFPHDIEIPYKLVWKKDGQKKIYSYHEGETTTATDFVGRIIPVDDNPRSFGRGSINLTAIRESDSGWFECRVYFPNRSPVTRNNGTLFKLEVEGNNLIVIPPANQTVMENVEVHLPCVAKQPETFIKWYKDNTAIESLELSTRSAISQNGTLIITNADMRDLGWYTCEIINADNDRQVATAYLNVRYKAKVIYTKPDIYLAYGLPAMLDCIFKANPPMINMRWEKDGFLFDPHNVRGVFERSNGSLYFEKVDESYAGQYTCEPFNKLGSGGPSALMTVLVRKPPVFTLTPVTVYLRKLGDNVVFPCDATSDGVNRPIIVWSKKDGSPLPEGRHSQHNGNLSLEKITESDRGFYRCSISNEAATLDFDTELAIEGLPPRAPYNIVASSTNDSITVRWVPASSTISFTNPQRWGSLALPEMEYYVWYKLVEVDEWHSITVPSARASEATINSLKPGREYVIRVLRQDKDGNAIFSKPIKTWTRGNRDDITPEKQEELGASSPMSQPRDLVVRLTAEGHLLEWSPPAYGEDQVRIYVVRWSRGPDERLVAAAETKNLYYLIQNLQDDEVYQLQVFAISTNDSQAASEMIWLRVPAYGAIRAAVAGVAVLLLLVLAGAALWFWRHKTAKLRQESGSKGNGAG